MSASGWKEYVEDINLVIKKFQELRDRVVEVGNRYDDENGDEYMMGLRYQQEPVRYALERLHYYPKRYVDNYRYPVERFQATCKRIQELFESGHKSTKRILDITRDEDIQRILKIVPCEEHDYHPDRGTISHCGGVKTITPPTEKWKG